jgi:hypothetical protein
VPMHLVSLYPSALSYCPAGGQFFWERQRLALALALVPVTDSVNP